MLTLGGSNYVMFLASSRIVRSTEWFAAICAKNSTVYARKNIELLVYSLAKGRWKDMQ